MKTTISTRTVVKRCFPRAVAASVVAAILCASHSSARAQESVAEKIERLDWQMSRVQAQLEQSESELREIQQQLSSLRGQAGLPGKPVSVDNASSGAESLVAAVNELREKQEVQESQIAAQEQSKVGSESRYPVMLSGMILFNGFVNTRAVDAAPTPAIAFSGPGATGATLRQSILGIDAGGPHLFGASSHADVRIDFDGAALTGYANSIGFVRFRTAHADLDWQHTKAFFSLDRPILSPDSPTSLTAVAEPALAWSGNLWTWNPQAGISEELPIHRNAAFEMEAALIDVADPYNPNVSSATLPVSPPTTAEQSRWPGVEGRLSVLSPMNDSAAHFGVGGFFAPHRIAGGPTFNSWAGTLDFRLPVFAHLELTGSAYRGQALGGLGGGAYKDIAYRVDGSESYLRTFDDVGGWAQAKQRVNERLEFNEAIGIDNVPGYQLQPFLLPSPNEYYNLARNRTFTSNVIYKPSAYLLYSIEYRRIESSFVDSPAARSDVIGVAAGYRF
jgi:hypothetical protein